MKYVFEGLALSLLILTASCGPTPEQEYETARDKVQAGEFTEAISILDDLLVENPDKAEAYNLRGVAYYNLEQHKEAISEFGQSIRVNPEDYRPYFNRAKAYRATDDLAAALQDYNEVISRQPQLADAYLDRSIILYGMDNLPAAYYDMQQALRLNSGDSLILLNSAKIFIKADSLTEAEKSLTSLLKIDRNHPDAYYLLGQIKLKQSQPEEACTLFKQASKAGHPKAQAMINLSCKPTTTL
jgi:tetratricopeptide (TPR) repeat protein